MSRNSYGFDLPGTAPTNPAADPLAEVPVAAAPPGAAAPVASAPIAPAPSAPMAQSELAPPAVETSGFEAAANGTRAFDDTAHGGPASRVTPYAATPGAAGYAPGFGGASPHSAVDPAPSRFGPGFGVSPPSGEADPSASGYAPGFGGPSALDASPAPGRYGATPASFGAVATLTREAPTPVDDPAPFARVDPAPAPPAAPLPETHGRAGVERPAPERSAVRRRLAAVRAFVLSGLLGVIVAVVAMFLLSIPFGFRSLTVMSGSMVPTLGVGDVVVERQISPTDLRVGDIVTFRDPTDQATLITHRVRSFKVHDGMVDVVTKGDANNTVEKWSIPVNGRLGVVVVHVPKIGYALVWASGRTGRIALIAIPGVILGIIELRRIWRPRRSPE
ncbi:MAG TPA: signal peptidase I [Actinomycetota bacterium]|nr:signal peptidase I [Actinomycetota bacterium]